MEEIKMKTLINSALLLVLACGFVACEKPAVPAKKESKVERPTPKRRMLSQQVEEPSQVQESQQ
jgi:hypothetical protein